VNPKKKWKRLPGGQLKRWKKSRGDHRPGGKHWLGVPPHWHRNLLNRRERRRAVRALHHGAVHNRPYVHPREAGWYW
jgi:hypothetical protein